MKMTSVAKLLFLTVSLVHSKISYAFVGSRTTKHLSLVVRPTVRNHPLLGLQASEKEHSDIMVDQNSTMKEQRQEDERVPIPDRVRVLSYRSTLFLTSLGFFVSCAVTLLQDSGLGYDTVMSLQQSSQATILWGSCITSLIIPPYQESNLDLGINERSTSSVPLSILNNSIPILAGLAILIKLIIAIQSNLSMNDVDITVEILPASTIDPVSAILLSAVCVREILYYGIGFKVEAVVAIALFVGQVLIPDLPDFVATSGLALALLVLSVGKVFEPVQTDLVPDKSAFFVKDT